VESRNQDQPGVAVGIEKLAVQDAGEQEPYRSHVEPEDAQKEESVLRPGPRIE
jgi:hypothetical protein